MQAPSCFLSVVSLYEKRGEERKRKKKARDQNSNSVIQQVLVLLRWPCAGRNNLAAQSTRPEISSNEAVMALSLTVSTQPGNVEVHDGRCSCCIAVVVAVSLLASISIELTHPTGRAVVCNQQRAHGEKVPYFAGPSSGQTSSCNPGRKGHIVDSKFLVGLGGILVMRLFCPGFHELLLDRHPSSLSCAHGLHPQMTAFVASIPGCPGAKTTAVNCSAVLMSAKRPNKPNRELSTAFMKSVQSYRSCQDHSGNGAYFAAWAVISSHTNQDQYATTYDRGLFNISMCLLPTVVCCLLLGWTSAPACSSLITTIMIVVDVASHGCGLLDYSQQWPYQYSPRSCD
ncbi:NPC1-like intracellular cholesterol transporter 1 [Lates japonicus]|uniref:NPC1-like intracellular cholesterol transporter 1 n=1 Tax=Lates japonicus TaxID=270547 RepID=A0AAD3N349_LATJO|nr:NPC1-like intracellular cholesterol transporter 1 [Lates japonicus]